VRGKWRLTEITKKQRTIIEKMKIGVPVEAIMVIKRAEFKLYSKIEEMYSTLPKTFPCSLSPGPPPK
jgi:hypothetical protein